MATPKSPNRPPIKQERYSVEHVRQALLDARGLVSVAARRLECSPDTVRGYARRHPTVAAALQEARNGILDMTEARLFQAANEGEPWAVVFILKNLGKERGYVEKQQVEHSGQVGTYIVDIGDTDDSSTGPT